MIKHIEMKDGYLILRSERAVQLYNELNISGDIWSFLSQLFNEASDNVGTKNESSEDIAQVKEMMMMMMKELKNAKAALPPPTDSVIPKATQVEPVSVVITETKKPKGMAGKLGSMLSNFDNMKK